MSPPTESLNLPLSRPLPLVPPQHSGQEALSLRGGHPSILSLPIQFTAAPHVWRHLSIFDQIFHFAANDPTLHPHPRRRQLFKCADTFLHNNLPILRLVEEASLSGAVHLELFYNYTITAEMHFCTLWCLPQFTALFIQFNSGCLFRGCKFGSFGFKWSIIAHIEIYTFLQEVPAS